MGKYIAIGHWKASRYISSIVTTQNTMRDFREDLKRNEFIPYIVMTEKRFNEIIELDRYDIFQEVKKMTTNYRKWDIVTEYICQCCDIIQEQCNS